MLESDFTQEFLSVTFDPGRKVSCLENNCRPHCSVTTFSSRSFGTEWYTMIAMESAKILVHSLLTWNSSPNTRHLVQVSNVFLIMNISWFGEIHGYCCFGGINVIWIKRCKEDCLSSFFTFFTSCHQSSVRNRMSVPRATHMVDELLPLVRDLHVIHQLWVNNPSA